MSFNSFSSSLSKNPRQSLFLGLLCVLLGQHMLSRPPVETAPSTALGIWLNGTLKLRLPDPDGTLWGLAFLLLGGLLLILAFTAWRSQPAEKLGHLHTIGAPRLRLTEWLPLTLVGSATFGILLLQLRNGEYYAYSAWLWLLAPLCFGILLGLWDRQRGIRWSMDITRQDALWMLGLLIFGLLFTTYRLQGWPDQLMGDEGLNGSVARDLAKGTFLPPLLAQGVDTFPILATYWQGWVMRYFGIDIWGWRMASVLPGVFTIVPLYLLARDAFNRRLAILAALAMLGLPFFLVFSRLGYMISQPIFILTLTLYLLQHGLRKESALYLYLAGLAAGLGFYSYFASRSAIVIAIAYVFLLWLTRQMDFRSTARTVGLLLFGVLLIAAPYSAYAGAAPGSAESMQYRIFLSLFNSVIYGGTFYPMEELTRYAPLYTTGDIQLFYNPQIFLVLIVRGYILTFLNFHMPGLMWEDHYMAIPLAGTVGAVFIFLGLLVALRNIRQARFQLVLLWGFIVVTTLSALNTFPPRDSHMTALIPALALLAAFGLEAAATILTTLISGLERYQKALFAFLLILLIGGGIRDYFVTGPKYFPQRAEDVMSWAALDYKDETFLYVYETPIRYEFVPWVVYELRQDVPFRSIQIEEFMQDSALLEKPRTVIFYPPELDSRLAPLLGTAWGDQLRPRTFLNEYEVPILMAGMNADFSFERDRPFPSTLLDAFQRPPFVLLLSALVTLFLLAAFFPFRHAMDAAARQWPQFVSGLFGRKPPGQSTDV
ncbi:MAG: glycosyltransferase family 39 protein [Chloroflexi bacterium]|nr:glycosyltransferase family 39 protein [Chloroflexota bacterium]